MKNLERLFSQTAKAIRSSEIRDLLKLVAKPNIISFAGGMPDPSSFPKSELVKIAEYVATEKTELAFQYGPTEGMPQMLEFLSQKFKSQGIDAAVNTLLITSGSQQALDIIGKIFLDPRDLVMTEEPAYLGALNAFRQYRCNFVPIACDSEGLQVDVASEQLKKLDRGGGSLPKLIYTNPTFQNPTGSVMPVSRRKKLVDLACEYDIFVVEDDPYSRIYFEEEPPPSIKSFDKEGHVIFLSTYSKILSPGIRLAYLCAQPELIKKMAIAKQALDLCTSSLSQILGYEYEKRSYEEKKIREIRENYKRKAELMISCMEENFPDGCEWTKPKGGMFTWVKVPSPLNTKEMLPKAIKKGVAYVVGTAFYANGGGEQGMRLNFSYPTHEEIKKGIKRLSEIIRDQI
ncbi:MAG TPA: PLP-dependent aminotransferase family protein [Thermoplasmata archaeon]|nr:PLP-dependent aminotransferase family protein [Thermoplasmata archaeon]